MLQNLLNRPWLLLGLLLAFLGLAAAVSLLVPSCRRQQDEKQQASLDAREQNQQQAGQAAHGQYLIDSTALATRRQILQGQLPAKLELPEYPPKEQ